MSPEERTASFEERFSDERDHIDRTEQHEEESIDEALMAQALNRMNSFFLNKVTS